MICSLVTDITFILLICFISKNVIKKVTSLCILILSPLQASLVCPGQIKEDFIVAVLC